MFLKKIAYSFHMPLFIMISGYLFYITRINKGSVFVGKEKRRKE